MSIAHKGSKLALRDYVHAIDFSSFHADFNVDASAIQYGDIILPTNDSLYTMRPFEGIFGGGIAVDEETTNLLDENMGKLYGLDAVTDINVVGFSWAKLISQDGTHTLNTYNTVELPCNPLTSYTLSVYMRLKRGTVSTGRVRLYINTDIGQIANKYIYPTNEWKRYTLTGVTQENATSITRATVWFGKEMDADIEIADWQFEEKPFATSFVVGTRNAGKLKYPISLSNDFTLSMWVKLCSDFSKNRYLFDTDTHSLYSFISTNGSLKLRYTNSDDQLIDLLTYNINSFEVPHFIAYTRSGNSLSVYVDGKFVAQASVDAIRENEMLFVGCYYLEGYEGNHIIDEFRVDRVAKSQEEIEAWYLSEKPFYNPYDYRAFS